MINVLTNIVDKEVITVAQYENIHSTFKCDVVVGCLGNSNNTCVML